MNEKRSRISGAIAGGVFAVLLFLSLAVIDPLREANDADLVDWWSTESNLDNLVASMYLRLLAIPFLLLFLAQLRSALQVSEGGSWPDVVQYSGIVCAAMLAFSGLTRGVTAQAVRFNDEPLPGVDTLRLVTELSYQAFAIGTIGMLAVAVAFTAVIILRTRALPQWLGWLSLPIAVVSLVAVPLQMGAFASPLLLIWVLATSFCLVRSNGASDEVAAVSARRVPQAG